MIMASGVSSLASMILVDESTGKRTIMAGSTPILLHPSEVPTELVRSAGYLHLDTTCRQAALDAARIARDSGVTVVLDADSLSRPDEIEGLLRLTDVLIASRVFSEGLTGLSDPQEAAEVMSGFGPAVTVVTLGGRGKCHPCGQSFVPHPSFSGMRRRYYWRGRRVPRCVHLGTTAGVES